METGNIVPRPPPGPRPDYLPKHRVGVRYLRRGSLPPLKMISTVPGISMRNKLRSASARATTSSSSNDPARHTAKSRARADFIGEERARFDEMFPPLDQLLEAARTVVVHKPFLKEQTPPKSEVSTGMEASTAVKDNQTQTSEIFEPQCEELKSIHPSEMNQPRHYPQWAEQGYFPETMEQNQCLETVEQEYAPEMVAKEYSPETERQMRSPERVVQTHFSVNVHQKQCPEKEDFATLLARRQEQYAKMNAEKQHYVEAIAKIKRMIDNYETFLALHPKQVAVVKQRKSVDVEEAEKARRVGDLRREFAIYKAHLEDLFYNKAQVVAQLKKEKEEQNRHEECLRAQIEMLKENDEIVIQRKMKLLREMLNEQSTDEEDKDECYEDGSENEDSEEAEKDEDEEEEFDKRDSGEEEDQGQDNCNTLYDEEVKDNGGDHCQKVNMTMNGPTKCVRYDLTRARDLPDSSHQLHRSAQVKETSENGNAGRRERLMRDFDANTRKELASEVEEDCLEQLERFGRLLRLETACDGTDHSEMRRMIESLYTLLERKHEADVLILGDNADKVNLGIEGERSEHGMRMPDFQFDDVAEDAGPILPAFTSTSINTSPDNSRASLEALKSDSSTELRLKENAFSSIPGSVEEMKERNAKRAAMEKARNGKKLVTFVDEGSKGGVKQQKSNVTFYAKMSANDLGELVSSALVSDIMSFAPNDEAGDGESLDSSDPSAIAVRYVSVITTEKNKSTLRPVFASKTDNKQNTLAFTITGEILLSSPTSEVTSSEDENVVADVVATDCSGKSPTVSFGPPVEIDCSNAVEKPQVSKVTLEYGHQEDGGTEWADADSDQSDVKELKITYESGVTKTALGSTNNAEKEFNDCLISCGSACECPSIATECGTQTETDTAEKALMCVPQMTSMQANEESFAPVVKNANGALAESSGLKLEFDITRMCRMVQNNPQINPMDASAILSITLDKTVFAQTVTKNSESVSMADKVAATSSDSSKEEETEKGPAAYHYRLTTPSLLNTPAELPREMPFDPEKCELMNTSSTKVAVPHSATEQNADETALVPFDSQIVTLKVFNTPTDSSTPNDMAVTQMKMGTKEKDVEENAEKAIVPFDSQIITLKPLGTATESEAADQSELAGNTDNALVPFDSQIVTLKMFKTATKPVTPTDVTAAHSKSVVQSTMDATPDIETDQMAATRATQDEQDEDYMCSIASQEEVRDLSTHSKTNSNGAPDSSAKNEGHDSGSSFLSKIRKSIASLRRVDLEKAVNPPDKRSLAEKLGLRQTKSRPDAIPVELRQPLLPLRPKVSKNIFRRRNSHATESGSLKAKSRVSMEPRSNQSVSSNETLKKPSLTTDDMTRLPSACASKLVLSRQNSHLQGTQHSDASITSDRADKSSSTTQDCGGAEQLNVVSNQSASCIIQRRKSFAAESGTLKARSRVSMQPVSDQSVSGKETLKAEAVEVSGSGLNNSKGFLNQPSLASAKERSCSSVLPAQECGGAEQLNMPHVTSNQSASNIIRSSKSFAAESRTLKARSRVSTQPGSYQSVSSKETLKAEDVEVPSSGLKRSKSFLSQPSLAGIDMMQLPSPRASKPELSRRSSHLHSIQYSEASIASGTGNGEHSSSMVLMAQECGGAEQLCKPQAKSLPATTLREAEGLSTNQMSRSQSAKISSVPKLPKL